MTTSDGGDGFDDPLEPPRDFREDVEQAEPEPVTEAMITPRTQPTLPPDEPSDVQVCRVCGEDNDPAASYCLACGVRLGEQPDDDVGEPQEWVDDGPEFDAGAGLLDPDEMDALAEPVADGGGDDAAPAAKEPRVTGRHILIGLLTAAIAILLFVTFQAQSGEPEASTTTTPAEDPSVMSAYLASLDELLGTVNEIDADALTINTDWDDRVEDYQTTLSRLTALESRASALPDLVSGLERPDGIDEAAHRGLVSTATTLAEAASEMVVGLEAPDTGEARRAALAKLQAAVTEFGTRVRTVGQSSDATPAS